MPVTVKGSGAKTRRPDRPGLHASVPPVVLAIVALVMVGIIGAGVFYLVNGGWQTESQKKWQFEHETAPLIAARRGRPELLEQENARRKAAGEPVLQVRERHEAAANMRGKLQELQSRMSGGQAPTGAP